MEKRLFGCMPDGTPIYECSLSNENFTVSIITYGGILRRFISYGVDIVCGFDCLEYYLADTSHQGALIGRYANRIDGGVFTLNGKTYSLRCNDCCDTVHLHGGPTGFSRRVWTIADADDTHVTLRLVSRSGDEGYPGTLTVNVTYTLLTDGLSIEYQAVSTEDTPICLTNHSYFNLDGCGAGKILDTIVTIDADFYSTLNERMIPIGHNAVKDTIFDFNTPHAIGARMDHFGGYDHNYILNGRNKDDRHGEPLTCAATADNGQLKLTVLTNQPCIQFYISNALEGDNPFKGGAMPRPHMAFCFEAQEEPNAPNRGEGILRAGERYYQHTVYLVQQNKQS